MAKSARSDEFTAILSEHQHRLRAFVLTLVRNRGDVDEILQETNLVLWQKFGDFTSGSNFFAWAATVARYQVMKWHERKGKERLIFQPATLDAIADEALSMDELLEGRRRMLSACIATLSSQQRKLIQERYRQGSSTDHMAQQRGLSVAAIYQQLSRIRRRLADCITRRLQAEGRA